MQKDVADRSRRVLEIDLQDLSEVCNLCFIGLKMRIDLEVLTTELIHLFVALQFDPELLEEVKSNTPRFIKIFSKAADSVLSNLVGEDSGLPLDRFDVLFQQVSSSVANLRRRNSQLQINSMHKW